MRSIRTKVVVAFAVIIVVTGAIAAATGVRLIGDGILRQAQEKVRTDLNSAREIFNHEVHIVMVIVGLNAERLYVKDALIRGDLQKLNTVIEAERMREKLDMLSLTDRDGRVIIRARNPSVVGDDMSSDDLVRQALAGKGCVAGIGRISREALLRESPDLAERAHIIYVPTPRAKPSSKTEEESGMVIEAAAPVCDYEGKLLGVLYGGNLLNRDAKIVDKIKETVFQGEKYDGNDIGAATIFQGDLRVATNVRTADGKRAIGTRIAEDVNEQVLVRGKPWIERAFVVKEWCFTAYEPLNDSKGEIIGALYVGILENKFTDIWNEAVLIHLGVTISGVLLAIVVGGFIASGITKPMRKLASVARRVAAGDMSQEIRVDGKDEVCELGVAFNTMTRAIRQRDEQLKSETQHALLQMEKMSSLGQMAAGVAHEINNPLSGVLTYTRLMLKNIRANNVRAPADLQQKLQTIETEVERCSRIIRGLLDFARQSKPAIRTTDVIKVVEASIALLAHQAKLAGVSIVRQFGEHGIQVEADPDQLQQVFTNIVLNAVQATPSNGTIAVEVAHDAAKGEVFISFKDNGAGIPQEHLRKLFTPFFTTKEKGKGIGLGLAICYGIIQRHGGDIAVESEVGKGTRFTVILREQRHAQISRLNRG